MKALQIAACTLACALAASAQGETDWAKLLKDGKVTLGEALETGLEEAGEGTAFQAELEGGSQGAVFSIDIAQGHKSRNVIVDSKKGKVVSNEVEDEDHLDTVEACEIDLADAIETALEKCPGKAVKAQMTLESGKSGVTVKVWGEGKLTTVKIDGATGKVLSAEAAKPKEKDPWTDTFRVEEDEWASTGRNPYFILEPGYELVYEGVDDGEEVKLIITVLDQTKTVDGVECRVVEEREWEGGELKEVSRNWFAISTRTNSVYYFGEEVDNYRNGKIANHHGAWEAGRNGARWGLLMPGEPLLGAKHYQEVAPGEALDRAEVVSLTEMVEVPAGKFKNVLRVAETTPLERGIEYKDYAFGVGLLADGAAKLVKYGKKKK